MAVGKTAGLPHNGRNLSKRLVCLVAASLLWACSSQSASPVGDRPAVAVDSKDPEFYKSLQTPPATIRTPEQALATFAIAPGYRIELAVAEPLIEDPVAMAWDEDGHLYVAEMRDGDGRAEWRRSLWIISTCLG